MKSLYRKYVHMLLINPLTYILFFLMLAFCSLGFYVFNGFFYNPESIGLERFYMLIPYGASFFIPVITSFVSGKKREGVISMYLAEMTVCLAFLILSLVPVCCSFIFKKAEFAPVFTASFGMFLFFSATVSFTIFVFSRVAKKGAAFLISCIFMLIFTAVHSVSGYVDFPDFIKNVLNYFSFSWHFNLFSKGVFPLKEAVFFIVLSAYFIALDYFVYEKKIGNRDSFLNRLFLLFSIGAVLILLIFSRIRFKADFSEGKRFSVSSYSKQLLKNVSEPLMIDYYLSPVLKANYPSVNSIDDFLLEYSQQNKNIKYGRINPESKNVSRRIEQAGISAQQLETASGIVNVYSAITVSYLGKTEILPFMLSTERLEYELSRRIRDMIFNKKRSVSILMGNNLSLGNDYSFVTPFLENSGFAVKEVFEDNFDLDTESILLIIGNENLTQEFGARLENYIYRGGRAFIAFQPYSVDFANEWSAVLTGETLERSLNSFGIYPRTTISADVSNFRLSLYSDTDSSGAKISPRTEYQNYSLWPVIKSFKIIPEGLTAFWPASFDYDNDVALTKSVFIEPLFYTSSAGWQYESYNREFVLNPFVVPKSPGSGMQKESLLLSLRANDMDSGKPLFIVSGDQYMFSNEMIYYVSSENYDLRALSYLSDSLYLLNGEEELLTLKKVYSVESKLKILNALEQEKYLSLVRLVIILIVSVPLVFCLLTAMAVLILRKRFNK